MFQIASFSKKIIGFCFFATILWACNSPKKSGELEVLPYYNTPEFNPLFLTSSSEVTEKVSHRLANFAFTNQNGQVIDNNFVFGKVHVANFFFTSCGSICPVMTKNLKTVAKQYKQDEQVAFLSYSVTPWIDSLPRLQEYAQRYDIQQPNWHFLTGSKAKTYELARQSYFAEEDIGFTKDSTEFLHTEHFILVDKNLRIRGIYNGTLLLEMQDLVADIERLKKE